MDDYKHISQTFTQFENKLCKLNKKYKLNFFCPTQNKTMHEIESYSYSLYFLKKYSALIKLH